MCNDGDDEFVCFSPVLQTSLFWSLVMLSSFELLLCVTNECFHLLPCVLPVAVLLVVAVVFVVVVVVVAVVIEVVEVGG